MLTTDIGPVIRPDFYSHHAAAAQTALIDRVVGDSSNNNNNNPALAISQSPRLGFTPSSKCSGGAGAVAAATKLFGDNEILEHPGLRGTPLAMLAAQCNKLSSKSPPPLADAAVGKGFHPWKKSSLLGSITSSASSGGNSAAVVNTTSSSNNNSIQSYSNSSSSSPHSQQQQLQRGLTNSSSGGSGAYGSSGRTGGQCGSTGATAGGGYGTDLYFHGYGSGNSVGCGEQSPPGFIGKVDAGVYSRVAAYDSWPFNAMAGAHSAIKPDVSSMNGSSWWDAVHGVAAGTGWLDGSAAAVSAGMHHHHHHHHAHHQMSNYNDYSSLTHSLAAASHPNILNAGQHLLQDTYKSMLPSQSVGSSVSSPFGLGQASLPQTVPSTRNQRRYTGRATCDCPNCQEAERLGPAGAHLRKKNIHSCHIPGCGKVYGKTSHLKAHLRWHTVKSPTTKPKPETTTTNSPSPNSQQSSSSSAAAARLKKPRKK